MEVIEKKTTVDDVIEKYVGIRDNLKLLQKRWKDIEDDMKHELDVISMWLRDKADELGVESFKTKHGTAYKSLKEHYRVGDWTAFIEYVKETDNFQLLEHRVAKNAAREVHHEDGNPPPGVEYFAEVEFLVRRPGKEKE